MMKCFKARDTQYKLVGYFRLYEFDEQPQDFLYAYAGLWVSNRLVAPARGERLNADGSRELVYTYEDRTETIDTEYYTTSDEAWYALSNRWCHPGIGSHVDTYAAASPAYDALSDPARWTNIKLIKGNSGFIRTPENHV
jgi:hypothetical protein